MSDPKIGANLPINTGISVENDRHKPLATDQGKRIDDRQYIPAKYKEVAANMEQQFAEMMIDQMNKTVEESDEGGDAGMDYYKSMQKSDRAKSLTQQNNLGLQDMILNQIYPKRMRTELGLKQYEAQTNRIHHNLPSYKIDKKVDTIEMGKNDSTSVSDGTTPVTIQKDGGLQ
ncbi:MAG: rod-binding protein, partial [Bacteriovorax sp.]|nr:rod-binding protein [Bacteriovorax sp.]